MEQIEFDTVEYNNLCAEGYTFIEIFTTGIELKMPEGKFKKEIVLVAHLDEPQNSENDIFDITDQALDAMKHGSKSEVYYILRS